MRLRGTAVLVHYLDKYYCDRNSLSDWSKAENELLKTNLAM